MTQQETNNSVASADDEQLQLAKNKEAYDRRTSQITTQFSAIRRLRDKLPSDLGNALYKIVYLPVVAIFPNKNFSDNRTLEKAGFRTYHFPGDEMQGYPVIADQAILMIDFEKFNQMYAAAKKEASADAYADHKDALAAWRAANKEWEAKRDAQNEAVEEWQAAADKQASKVRRFEAYLEASKIYAEAFEKYQKELAQFKAGKISKAPTKPNKPIPVMKPKELPPQPEAFDEEANPRPERPKSMSRNFSVSLDDMSDVVIELAKDLRELLNVDYVLMSADHRSNSKNGSVICFWLAERWKYKKLEKIARVSVQSWNFAFE